MDGTEDSIIHLQQHSLYTAVSTEGPRAAKMQYRFTTALILDQKKKKPTTTTTPHHAFSNSM